MPNPTITFQVSSDEKGNSFLKTTLHRDGVPDGDIRLKFAQLAMGYASQVGEKGPFAISPVSAGDHVSATLTFTQDYEAEYPDDDDPDYYEESQPVPNSIGCSLHVGDLGDADHRPFGWAASPAVLAATSVSKMVGIAIEQAAGIAHSVDADGPSL